MKSLHINGSKYFLQSSLTVSELLDYLGFNKNVIVVDYNGYILEKRLWEEKYLQDKDSLEILSMAGGG